MIGLRAMLAYSEWAKRSKRRPALMRMVVRINDAKVYRLLFTAERMEAEPLPWIKFPQ